MNKIIGFDHETKEIRVLNPKEMLSKEYKFYFDPIQLINQLPCDQSMFREY